MHRVLFCLGVRGMPNSSTSGTGRTQPLVLSEDESLLCDLPPMMDWGFDVKTSRFLVCLIHLGGKSASCRYATTQRQQVTAVAVALV